MSIYSTSKQFYQEPITSAEYAEEMKAEYESMRFEKLKKALFDWGDDYIEEFLGYSEDVNGMSRNEIEELMDDAYDQMEEEELQEFYDKFEIDKSIMEEQAERLCE